MTDPDAYTRFLEISRQGPVRRLRQALDALRREPTAPIGSDNLTVDWSDDELYRRLRSLYPEPVIMEGR